MSLYPPISSMLVPCLLCICCFSTAAFAQYSTFHEEKRYDALACSVMAQPDFIVNCPVVVKRWFGRQQTKTPTAPPSCWQGGYTREVCCDVTRGPNGNTQCWDGVHTFDTCCVDTPETHTPTHIGGTPDGQGGEPLSPGDAVSEDTEYASWRTHQMYMMPMLSLPPLDWILENQVPKQPHSTDPPGLWLEFGVHMGETINKISKFLEKETPRDGVSGDIQVVYGFDSFRGFPVDWRAADDRNFWDLKGVHPPVAHNVRLREGWFNESIPEYLAAVSNPADSNNQLRPIHLLHIDSDLYLSAKQIFDLLENHIVSGTVIVFDELIHYPGFERHEFLAFYEYVKRTGKKFRWLGRYACPLVYHIPEGLPDPLLRVHFDPSRGRTYVSENYGDCEGAAVLIL
eukprot:GDKI01049202.1.p1 GENE.GDKI01049202.1~~GDKI01049202.1.p1  ORF type:complete len:399 (-),score=60.72 GDKI01049202.1:762-1958(-)